jgi:hypothetical protein
MDDMQWKLQPVPLCAPLFQYLTLVGKRLINQSVPVRLFLRSGLIFNRYNPVKGMRVVAVHFILYAQLNRSAATGSPHPNQLFTTFGNALYGHAYSIHHHLAKSGRKNLQVIDLKLKKSFFSL